MKQRGKVDVEAHVNGGGFLLDEEEEGSAAPPFVVDHGTQGRSASGLHLILEESNSLILDTPLATLSGTSITDLDASSIRTL